jgi:subtilisin family serine protease
MGTPRTTLRAALAALVAGTVLGAGGAGPAGAVTPGPAAPERGYTVTLVSTDRVHVQPHRGAPPSLRVLPGRGRARMRFATRRLPGGGVQVIPADALPLVAADRLDPRLFDVVLLGRLRYDDAHRRDVPLILTGAPGRAPRTFSAQGAAQQRTLPTIGATVVHQDKASAGSFWAAATGPRPAEAGTRKIWLSSAYRTLLDRSVPQIGGPVAWRAGFTGRGVRVAVLDTGIDTSHPDLAAAVETSRDFSGSADGTRDTVGHGTHVASILAGRGTASGGRYTGVAKGATLLSGKVCDDVFCSEEAVLAGMEWAATEGVKVANLSLGGPVGDGVDPIVAALDRLTAVAGTLFVVAAGNDGAPETVGSPATANSALAVGSVGRTDALSDFSSRGPRVTASRRLDYAIKPDITAPGEDIVAAQAQGIDPIGEPQGQWYQALSGTSMATPHVTGSAAVLAQAHPTFTAAQLKAALMSTAAPQPATTVYEQGAGRVDVGRAATQQVYADAGSLSLGYFPWPHRSERPATRTVTYRNVGTRAVTLSLRSTFADAAGRPAAAGVLRIGRRSVTVPAGGTAAVPVTLTPARAAVGLYGGRLDARSADGAVVLTTALGAYSEPESYDLTLTSLDTAGQAAAYAVAFVVDARTGDFSLLDMAGGAGVLRRPAGTYIVLATILGPDTATIEARTVSLRRTTEMTLDARQSNPVTIAAPGVPDAVPDDLAFFLADLGVGNSGFGSGLIGPTSFMRVTPTRGRIAGLGWAFFGELRKAGSGGVLDPGPPSPFVYHGAFQGAGTLPAHPAFRFTGADTATVTHHFARQSPGAERLFGAESTSRTGGLGVYRELGDLAQRVDHYSVGRDLTWTDRLLQGEVPTSDQYVHTADIVDRDVPHRVGEHSTQRWNAGPFGPAPALVGRYGDFLDAALPLITDSAPGHLGMPDSAYDHGTATLYRGGDVVATSDTAAYLSAEGLPAAESAYRLVAENTRTAAWTQFATRVRAEWTFRSARAPEGGTVLPLAGVRFAPRLDELNRAPASGTFGVPVRVERSDGTVPDVASLTVQVSYDDGATWTEVPLTGSGATRTATLTHPGRAGWVSLRATAAGRDGATVTQTVIHAYALL